MLEDHSTLHETLGRLGLAADDAVGVGTTSIVLPYGDHVGRLSMDWASHQFLVEAAHQRNLASPRVFRNHGEVGNYEGDGEDTPFYFLECERLLPLNDCPEQEACIKEWCEQIDMNLADGSLFSGRERITEFRAFVVASRHVA